MADLLLTNITREYLEQRGSLPRDRIFPQIPVQLQTSTYYTFKHGGWRRRHFPRTRAWVARARRIVDAVREAW